MLTNVRQENPAKGILPITIAQRRRADNLISFLAILLQEHYMAPGRGAEMSGVVVRISRPSKTVVRHMIPFFARHFAGLAPDTYAWIGEEADLDVIFHEGMLPLVRTLDSLADHNVSCLVGDS